MPSRTVSRIAPLPLAAALVLVAGVAFGMVAVLLSGTGPTPPGWAYSGPLPGVNLEDVGFVVFVIFGLFVTYRIVQRLAGVSQSFPLKSVLIALTVVLWVVGFAVFFRYIGAQELASFQPAQEPQCPAQNCTGIGPPGQGSQPPSNATAIPPSTTGLGLPWGLSWWVAYLALGGVVAAVALVALPLIARRLERGGELARAAPAPSTEAVRSAVVDAIAALDRWPEADPRGTIIELYGRLIDVMHLRMLEVDPLTAREIERYCVEELGVGTQTARELTRLFEEARYSTRPMGLAEAHRAASALAALLRELAPDTA